MNGPVIVGAGPSGLAVGAGHKTQGVPFIILERANCIASLWQNNTYDRLKLHLPKRFCQLPNFPFPEDFPEYPTKRQFIAYLESYAKHFTRLLSMMGFRIAPMTCWCGSRTRSINSWCELPTVLLSAWRIPATQSTPRPNAMAQPGGRFGGSTCLQRYEPFYGGLALTVYRLKRPVKVEAKCEICC